MVGITRDLFSDADAYSLFGGSPAPKSIDAVL